MARSRYAKSKSARAVLVALVAVVLIAAIVLAVWFFTAPDSFKATFPFFFAAEDAGTEAPPLTRGEGELQVHFLDVGQGDSILILFPDGKDMLIDCGTTRGGSWEAVDEYMDDYVTDGQLDYLMLTHTDKDHVGYLPDVLEKYDVDTVFMPNVLSEPSGTQSSERLQAEIDALDQNKVGMFTDDDTVSSNTYAEFFIAALSEPDCEIILTVDPDEDTNSIVITDDGVQDPGSPDEDATYRLTFYCPTEEYYASSDLSDAPDINAVSPVGILEYNDVRIVLTGDSNEINEPIVAERLGYLDCDVLKVAHHGSESSSLEIFLEAVDCEYAVISCGAGNNHKHPTQAALDRLIEDGMTIYRTDNNGNIVLTVDKNGEMTFTPEREVDQSVNRVGADAALSGDVFREFIATEEN